MVRPPQADTGIMRVTGQAAARAATGFMCELEAEGEEEGEDAFDKRFAIAKQLIIGRFVLKVDGDGPVFTGLADGVAHGSSSGQMVGMADDPTWGNACPIARGWGRRRGVTTKLGGMCTFPLPLGKTRFLAAVTVDTCGAWAVCPRDEHGHVLLFPYRFQDALSEHAFPPTIYLTLL